MVTPNNMNNMVQIRDLSFKRDTKVIFDRVNFEFQRGKITAVMGPSGTGKTTLLRFIGGELQALPGHVFVDEIDIGKLSLKKLYRLRHRMGLLFQEGALFTDLNVFDNVAFPLRELTSLPESVISDLVLMKLEAVGLRGARHLRIEELSGGMAHRVALARAIISDPDLMMYDEPLTGQDPVTRGVLMRLIKQLNEALELTSIIVSHEVSEMLEIADYIYVLSGGKIMGKGTPDQLSNSDLPYVKQFINGFPDGAVPFDYSTKSSYQEDLDLC